MTAPAFTIAAIAKLGPCRSRFDALRDVLPKHARITAAEARDKGASLSDIEWVAASFALARKDIKRRYRLWLADCAAHVRHIYEQAETGDTPRLAIIAARQYVRGEIDAAARDAARLVIWDTRDAGWLARRPSVSAAWDAAIAAVGDGVRNCAVRAAARVARDAAWAAARVAIDAGDAARVAIDAGDAAFAAAFDAAWDAEEKWQFDRLIAWLSNVEPTDWPLPVREVKAA